MGGELIELQAEPEVSVVAAPEPIALDIVYEDDALMAINKPVGLVVHPGAGNPRGTLMNGLLHHAAELDRLPRAGIIHRLDKETTGLLLIGKTLEAHTALVRLLADREIARRYVAICNGVLTGGGTIDEPIGRHPVDRKRMSVRPEGKPAVTHYTVLHRFAAHTHISVALETGRTHQIRVHTQTMGHPLVIDERYGDKDANRRAGKLGLKRLFLHAQSIAFPDKSGNELHFTAPLADDLDDFLSHGLRTPKSTKRRKQK